MAAPADPGLSALLLWLLLPAALAIGALCLALWWPRRGWTVLHARVVASVAPEPGWIEVAVAGADDTPRIVRLRPLRPELPPRPGAEITFCHPPGQPDALQQGTPGPLLAGAIAAGLVAALSLVTAIGG